MLMISDSSIIWGESICMFETDLSNQLISYIVSLEIFSDSSIIWRESICMFETDLSNQLISYIVSLEIFSNSSIIREKAYVCLKLIYQSD